MATPSLAARIDALDPKRPVLIAGPTASGKSALAIEIATRQGGVIVNADAIQVFADWRVLTARPSPEEERQARHMLYGHIPGTQAYSVGDWLREIAPLLSNRALLPDQQAARPIITGGTGLYFTALTEGLAEIPATPPEIRAEADKRLRTHGLDALVSELDPESAAAIDLKNPMRVQRAWEVLRATGKGIRAWQSETPPALLPLDQAQPFLFDAPKDWLTPRIERRFDKMLAEGALEEARANLADWSPDKPSSKAIGAAELIAHLKGEMTLNEARDRATILTRQFAKRQRTWFKSRMAGWPRITPDDLPQGRA